MKNFEKADIITEVAYKKNKNRFLPRDEQMRLNNEMKQKIVRFAGEIASEKDRPQAMKLFDEMMNGMHGQRVKDLYAYRREGNHIVALLCNSIPPELIYALGNFIPVSICMGAGEVESYASHYTEGMCTLTRSMIGFLYTGMCVFFNLADYVLASDLCPSIKKASELVVEISDDFEVFCLKGQKNSKSIEVDFKMFERWIEKITSGKGIDQKRLVEFSRLFSEIREEYKSILGLRKNSNPPINGKNSLWIQQLFLVEDPFKLLFALKELNRELHQRVQKNIGYNQNGRKKRIMLITPRIMPPFGEIYRLVENAGALIVCEEIDMGITNINYDLNEFLRIIHEDNDGIEQPVKYILESLDQNSSSCIPEFDFGRIRQKIVEYNVDAVICYSFKGCPIMQNKTKKIIELLNRKDVPALQLTTDYIEIYEKEEEYKEEIARFLNF